MPEEYTYEVRIPKDRIAVLIGKKGETKKHLEEVGDVGIDVDSEDGEVTLSGENTINLFQMQEVVKAIGRGFNPEIAQLLLKQDYVLEMVDVTKIVGESKKQEIRARGRVIGKNGRAREMIENISGAFVSVYGKTVSIIGTVARAGAARKAVESLVAGSKHGPVYAKLQKTVNELSSKEMLG